MIKPSGSDKNNNPKGSVTSNSLMMNDKIELDNKKSFSFRSAESIKEFEFQVDDATDANKKK